MDINMKILLFSVKWVVNLLTSYWFNFDKKKHMWFSLSYQSIIQYKIMYFFALKFLYRKTEKLKQWILLHFVNEKKN